MGGTASNEEVIGNTPPKGGNVSNMEEQSVGVSHGVDWPLWAKCVTCYQNKIGQDAEDDVVVKLYGSRSFFFLPCSHVVCSEECLRACRRRKGGGVPSPQEDSRCPTCRIGFCYAMVIATGTLRPLEFTRHAPSETVRLKKKCQGCIRKDAFSIKYCQDCSLTICQYCANQHSYMIDTAQHSVVESDQVYDIVPKSNLCNEHPTQYLKAYCNDCDLQLCQECISEEGRHSLHDTCDLEELVQRTLDELKEISEEHSQIMKTCNQHHEDLRKQIQTVEDHSKKVQEDSTWALNKIVELFGQQELDLREDIICAVTIKTYELNLQNTVYKSLISQGEAFKSFCKTFNDSDLRRNKSKSNLLTRFYNLLKEKAEYLKQTSAQLAQEQPIGNLTLTDYTSEVLEAVEKIWSNEGEELSNLELVSTPNDNETLPLSAPSGFNLVPADSLESVASTSRSTRSLLMADPTPMIMPPSTPAITMPTVLSDQVVNEVEVTSTIVTPTIEDVLEKSLPTPKPSLPPPETEVEDMNTSTSTSQPLPINTTPASHIYLPTGQSQIISVTDQVEPPSIVSANRETVAGPESDDESDYDPRLAFMCDFDDSSDDERIRIKNEPIDYDDRDEAPPDEDDDTRDVPFIVIKKEINYDYQEYGEEMGVGIPLELQNGHGSFFFHSDSNSSSEDGERNAIFGLPRSRRIKSAGRRRKQRESSTGQESEEYIGVDAADKFTENDTNTETLTHHIPHTLMTVPVENERMISSQQEVESAQYFDDEWILPDNPSSPLADNKDSDDDYFNELPDTGNEQEETEPDEILDPETGLLMHVGLVCEVEDIVTLENSPNEPPIIEETTDPLANNEDIDENVTIPTLVSAQDSEKDPLSDEILPLATAPSKPTGRCTSSPFNVPSLNHLTPTLLKFAHTRGQEKDKRTSVSESSQIQRPRAMRKVKSVTVESQTIQDVRIVTKAPEPVQNESPLAELSTLSEVQTIPEVIDACPPLVTEESVATPEDGTSTLAEVVSTSEDPIPKVPQIPVVPIPTELPILLERPSVIIPLPVMTPSLTLTPTTVVPPKRQNGMTTTAEGYPKSVESVVPSLSIVLNKSQMPGIVLARGEFPTSTPTTSTLIISEVMRNMEDPPILAKMGDVVKPLTPESQYSSEARRSNIHQIIHQPENIAAKDTTQVATNTTVETARIETASQIFPKRAPGAVSSIHDQSPPLLGKQAPAPTGMSTRCQDLEAVDALFLLQQSDRNTNIPQRVAGTESIAVANNIITNGDVWGLPPILTPESPGVQQNKTQRPSDRTEVPKKRKRDRSIGFENKDDNRNMPNIKKARMEAFDLETNGYGNSEDGVMSDKSGSVSSPSSARRKSNLPATETRPMRRPIKSDRISARPRISQGVDFLGVTNRSPNQGNRTPTRESLDISSVQSSFTIRSISDTTNKSVPLKKRIRYTSHDNPMRLPIVSDVRKSQNITEAVASALNVSKPNSPQSQSPRREELKLDEKTNKRKNSSGQSPLTPRSKDVTYSYPNSPANNTETISSKSMASPQPCTTGKSNGHPAETNVPTQDNNEKDFPETPEPIQNGMEQRNNLNRTENMVKTPSSSIVKSVPIYEFPKKYYVNSKPEKKNRIFKSKTNDVTPAKMGNQTDFYGMFNSLVSPDDPLEKNEFVFVESPPAPRKRGRPPKSGSKSESVKITKPKITPTKSGSVSKRGSKRGRPLGWRKNVGGSYKQGRSHVAEDGEIEWNSEDAVVPRSASIGKRLERHFNSETLLGGSLRGSQSPASRGRKKNRSESSRWSARIVRSQSVESTSSRIQAKKRLDKERLAKTGPKLILTRSKTPTTPRPETPASIRLSVDSMG